MLCCPVCGEALSVGEKRAVCAHNHSFDRAKEGYLNLLMRSDRKGHGDDRAMLRARRAFLEAGHYAPLAEAVCRLAREACDPAGALLDAGCGEGYYTERIADQIGWEHPEESVFAFDIARDGAAMTAKRLKGKGTVFVASSYRIPMASGSVSLLTSLFSPYAEAEFARVLRPDGVLLRAVVREDHLWELKQALYETPRLSLAADPALKEFEVIKEEAVRFAMKLSGAGEIGALFGMTPFVHKSSPAAIEKIQTMESLAVTASFSVLLYRARG